jgi:hypothetical protein
LVSLQSWVWLPRSALVCGGRRSVTRRVDPKRTRLRLYRCAYRAVCCCR